MTDYVDNLVLKDYTGKPGSTFDTGYVNFDDTKDPQLSVGSWDTKDWKNAIGHCYVRITGSVAANGDLTVNLSITGIYEFRDGQNFGHGHR